MQQWAYHNVFQFKNRIDIHPQRLGKCLDHFWSKSAVWQSHPTRSKILFQDHIWLISAVWYILLPHLALVCCGTCFLPHLVTKPLYRQFILTHERSLLKKFQLEQPHYYHHHLPGIHAQETQSHEETRPDLQVREFYGPLDWRNQGQDYRSHWYCQSRFPESPVPLRPQASLQFSWHTNHHCRKLFKQAGRVHHGQVQHGIHPWVSLL